MRFLFAAVIFASWCTAAAAVTIDTVPIGNPGNPDDTTDYYNSYEKPPLFRGSVPYEFRMGKYEVTVGQYTEFLNAVAVADANLLYNLQIPGIARSGLPGSYSFAVVGSPNKPVSRVSFYSAVRFANWLHNGQPTGLQDATTTEDGAYTLTGPSSVGARNPGATWFLPNEDEWYKAAYYDPDASLYWEYPTGTDDVPASALPPGTGAPVPPNTANYFSDDGLANGYNDGFAATGSTDENANLLDYLTDVGSYAEAASPYGTFDQGGNLDEWVEDVTYGPTFRHVFGGSWKNIDAFEMHASNDHFRRATTVTTIIGFRVANIPEPSTILLAVMGLATLPIFARRRKR